MSLILLCIFFMFGRVCISLMVFCVRVVDGVVLVIIIMFVFVLLMVSGKVCRFLFCCRVVWVWLVSVVLFVCVWVICGLVGVGVGVVIGVCLVVKMVVVVFVIRVVDSSWVKVDVCCM